jgi:magnesium transporter
LILHGPERGPSGHVHYIELDQIISDKYIVTVHGPLNPAVDPAVALRETEAVRRRLVAGKLRPDSPYELSYAVVSALAHRLEAFIEELTHEVWQLEQRVTGGHMGNPEEFLEELFQARHGLLAVRTMGALGSEVYGRIGALQDRVPADDLPLVNDVVDQLNRIRGLADGEREYLQGVIEYYRTRADTKMTIAAERLAVIAVVTLPITALSSVYGMNIIVNGHTRVAQLIVVLGQSAMRPRRVPSGRSGRRPWPICPDSRPTPIFWYRFDERFDHARTWACAAPGASPHGAPGDRPGALR